MFNDWKQKWQLVINEFMNKNSYKIINNIQQDYNDKIKNLEQKYEQQINFLLEQNKKLIERLDKHGKTLSKLNAKIQIKAEITDIKKIKSEIIEETGIKKQVKIQEDFRLLRFDWNEFKKQEIKKLNSLPFQVKLEMELSEIITIIVKETKEHMDLNTFREKILNLFLKKYSINEIDFEILKQNMSHTSSSNLYLKTSKIWNLYRHNAL